MHVLFDVRQNKNEHLGVITLNRPESLNALSKQMIAEISAKLNNWAQDPKINAVLIRSNSERAFCAGGDIKRLYTLGPEHYQQEVEYFRTEYLLSETIYNYPKPYIALLNGIAMGGGLGVSIHGSQRIAGSSLKLAVPETKIGLYPDAGATFFLSRCPHHLGMYLGLTGNIIGVADAMLCGLIDVCLTEPGASLLEVHLDTISSCFSQTSVPAVIEALKQHKSAWAHEQAEIIESRSPTSLKVTHQAITRAKDLNIHDCLEMEFNLTINILQSHDLYEGIRAVLIDKGQTAKWQPAQLQDVDDALINEMFNIKCNL